MATDEPGRISVSRDHLRADLAEMELRLRSYIEALMATKADAAAVDRLMTRIVSLEATRTLRDAGELSPAQTRVIDEQIRVSMDGREEKSWATKEKVMTVLSICTTAAMLLLSVVLALHGVTLP